MQGLARARRSPSEHIQRRPLPTGSQRCARLLSCSFSHETGLTVRWKAKAVIVIIVPMNDRSVRVSSQNDEIVDPKAPPLDATDHHCPLPVATDGNSDIDPLVSAAASSDSALFTVPASTNAQNHNQRKANDGSFGIYFGGMERTW